MKKICFLLFSIVIGILVYKESDEIIIPKDAIRVRIIANSNSIRDLYQKKLIKEEIKKDLYSLVENSKSNIEARENILNNIDTIKEKLSTKIKDFKVDYGLNYFPKKIYKDVVYQEGEYESLIITLGSGLGDNWWCVLYPPLCMLEDNETTSDVEYRFMVSELLKN